MTETTKNAAHRLDQTSGELHLATRAISYVYNRLAALTEKDINQIKSEGELWALQLFYNEVQDLSIILGGYVLQLEKHDNTIDQVATDIFSEAE